MGIKVYHQVGHFPTWNVSSFDTDGCGDGLILSPVHQPMAALMRLPDTLKRRSLFDPQYYLPNSPKVKLATYPFFPEQITGGFATKDFPLVALESATKCVAFQIEQDFEAVVIPARFMDQMAPRYFDRQEEYTVVPFLKALSDLGTSKPVYLTLPLTSAMLEDADFRTQLLNWVTGFAEISGIYILVNDDRTAKQIQSNSLLCAYMSFMSELSGASLRVVAGHLNSESVLFSVIEGVILTFGSFENTRMFSLEKFIESEEERRAPKPRIYLPALLNWLQFDQAMQIRSDAPKLWDKIYSPSRHGNDVISASATVEPYFNQPGLYKHHFVCMHEQLKSLGAMSVQNRFVAVRTAIKSAIALYKEIEDMPLDLDSHGSGGHLQAWLDALNWYYRQYLK